MNLNLTYGNYSLENASTADQTVLFSCTPPGAATATIECYSNVSDSANITLTFTAGAIIGGGGGGGGFSVTNVTVLNFTEPNATWWDLWLRGYDFGYAVLSITPVSKTVNLLGHDFVIISFVVQNKGTLPNVFIVLLVLAYGIVATSERRRLSLVSYLLLLVLLWIVAFYIPVLVV